MLSAAARKDCPEKEIIRRLKRYAAREACRQLRDGA